MVLSSKPVRIPIRQIGAGDADARPRRQEAAGAEDAANKTAGAANKTAGAANKTAGAARHDAASAEADSAPATSRQSGADADIDWKNKALRLQAEMQTYRQRQQRWAAAQVVEEKAALLTSFLEVVDNLEQSLAHLNADDPAHQGVQLAYDALTRMLIREGVERIFAQGQAFDPDVHEAVAVVPAAPSQREEMRVVDVTQSGYRYQGRVLRPAKVVVAK